MLIQKLPNELVDQIISLCLSAEWDHDVNLRTHMDYKTALSLMLTCKTINKLVKPILYEHVTLKSCISANVEQGFPALESCGDLVGSFDFPLDMTAGLSVVSRTLLLAATMLEKLPNLRKLHIPSIFFGYHHLRPSQRDTLVKLEIDSICHSFTASHLLDLLSHPKLRFLRLKKGSCLTYNNNNLAEPLIQNTILESIEIGGPDMPCEISPLIAAMVARCKNLKTVRWYYYPQGLALSRNETTGAGIISMSQILEPVSPTLETLCLYPMTKDEANSLFWWRDIAQSLDLSEFTALQHLAVNSMFFLPLRAVSLSAPTPGFYKHLPKSLKTLNLYFRRDQCDTFLESKIIEEIQKRGLPEDAEISSEVVKYVEEQFRWATELVEQKALGNFALETITLIGPPFPDHGTKPALMSVPPPTHLESIFSACKSVGIRVNFCMSLDMGST
ncbi:hypothetical protein HYFRA_00005608 [Hymenoscyphus fraxineus]|uniref:Leucine-rich repeat domain-containing protein n=1 Tax=Hymenoscyphus fraxineus TaxID=746836 RepID=A0A9N9KQU7_9HELO|nr:hypothetical protein HYFRA_00005608 [Hymenoscyphus fraxineus]